MKQTGEGRAFSRVALAGNPSDGYGGGTLAVVVRDFRAEAIASAGTSDQIASPGRGGEELMGAALARFRKWAGGPEAVCLSCQTNVPREVGLAGSSAIVIACARALCDLVGVEFEPQELARFALAVETEDLGIAAGLQDRVVQSCESLVAMDFHGGAEYEELDPALLPPLFVAWHPGAASPSGLAHAELRERYSRGNVAVRAGMQRLGRLASDARVALLDGDYAAFARCVDASFDERLLLMQVDPLTREMVEAARSAGASANSAGSGGAIVGTLSGDDSWDRLRDALEQLGASTMRPQVCP